MKAVLKTKKGGKDRPYLYFIGKNIYATDKKTILQRTPFYRKRFIQT